MAKIEIDYVFIKKARKDKEKYKLIIRNYICLFDYLFISS